MRSGLIVFLFLIFFSCQQRSKEEFSDTSSESVAEGGAAGMVADSVGSDLLSKVASEPVEAGKTEVAPFYTATGLVLTDTTRKIIRTADIRFEVKNLLASSKQIEGTTLGLGGFVLQTNIVAENESTSRKRISEDSVLIVKSFDLVNRLTVRVPTNRLSEFLEKIFPLVHYLNYRNINGEDVTLDILANQQKAKRIDNFTKRAQSHIDRKGKKLPETNSAENNLLDRQMESDRVRFEILSLGDRLAFSTLNIEIYQQELSNSTMVLNAKETNAYEPGFFTKLSNSLANGWNGVLNFILFVADIWGLVLLIVFASFLWWKFRKKAQANLPRENQSDRS